MKIIWITLESPLPANTGGRIGVYKRIEQISKSNEIYLFYPYDNDSEIEKVCELNNLCCKVYAYKRKKKSFNVLFKSLFKPFTVVSRDIREMQEDMEYLLTHEKIDLINVDFPHMCINLINIYKKFNVPIILNEHNIEWKFYKAISKSSHNIIKKIVYGFDSIRLKHYEERLSKKIDFKGVTFVSDKDLNYYKKWIGEQSKLEHIPVGAELKNGLPPADNGESKKIIFVGLMSAAPNAEGAMWFVKKIFSKILEKFPKAVFYAVGKNPCNEVLALVCDNVKITGTVESVDEYYKNADLIVIPLFNGGGVKIKLLEAVSYKRPVVTTECGAEGTAFVANEHLRITDNSDLFAEYCIDALSCSDESKRLTENAYKFFCENYTWEQIGKKYDNFLKSI